MPPWPWMPKDASPAAAESTTGSPAPAEGRGGPMLALLARGLELWLRQQCEAIGDLEIQLEGSAAELLRGRLEGVRLTARQVVYQRLEIEQVTLRSEAIRVRMGVLLRSRTVQLEHAFRVRGQVVFSGEGLGRSFSIPPWSGLGDGLAEELLGLAPLSGIRIADDRLILSAPGGIDPPGEGRPIELATEVAAVEGTVELRAEPGARRSRLPMDPKIRIERAQLGGGLLELGGEALVSA